MFFYSSIVNEKMHMRMLNVDVVKLALHTCYKFLILADQFKIVFLLICLLPLDLF